MVFNFSYFNAEYFYNNVFYQYLNQVSSVFHFCQTHGGLSLRVTLLAMVDTWKDLEVTTKRQMSVSATWYHVNVRHVPCGAAELNVIIIKLGFDVNVNEIIIKFWINVNVVENINVHSSPVLSHTFHVI